jgi:DNA mismatch repair protein MutL
MKRIAAGEVVERPASVVKELLENAIDAGATSVTVLLKGAGLDLIQVIDDGGGMTEEDALLCVQRHATSKIACAEDLDSIETLGFRGEALASIGSVSRMVITTRTESEAEATQVLLENGTLQEVLKAAAPRGTSVAVKNLFAFVPARRKFLKHPTTELRHAAAAVRRIALSHPAVGFSLFVEEQKTMLVRPDSGRNRVRDLWGEDKAALLVPVRKEVAGVRIDGFVGKPDASVKHRDDQFLFLNRRFIQNRSLAHAVASAYGPRLRPGEFPLFVLFLEMDPRRFDVNVHPTKIEVRFSDERFVYDVVRKAVEEILRSPDAVPEFHLVPGGRAAAISSKPVFHPSDFGQLTLDVQRSLPQSEQAQAPGPAEGLPEFWQVHQRYILASIKSGLVLIDQHVAHERILYEKAVKSIHDRIGASQQLLFPATVQLQPEDMLALTEIQPFLARIGFGLKEFGNRTMVIESVPVDVKPGREREILVGMIEEYRNDPESGRLTWDRVAKAYACRSAVKAGDRLSRQEMASLVDQLFATQDPTVCPHGRPVILHLTIEEIDKRFGR